MDERKRAVVKAKFGMISIVVMLFINILLASFLFFDMREIKVRELFLALCTLMILIYAVTFPTKLLPSGSFLIKNVVLMILPHIIVQLICTAGMSAMSIMGYVIGIVASVFCTYMCMTSTSKIIRYISEEALNDYVLFEYKTFKVQEINLYSLAFLIINFFILMAADSDMILTIFVYINLLVSITLNFYRTRDAKNDRVKMSYYVLESICSLLAYTLVVIVHALELSGFINIAAFVLLVPTIAMTMLVYKSLDSFMH